VALYPLYDAVLKMLAVCTDEFTEHGERLNLSHIHLKMLV